MLQVQDQSLRTVATAHLAQTMSLLVLGNLDLQEKIFEELEKNPALELLDERVCPTCQRPLSGAAQCPKCSLPTKEDTPLVFISPRESFRAGRSQPLEEDYSDMEPVAPESLAEFVLRQLAGDLDPEDRPLAAFILSSLDDDGFLQDPMVYIMRTTRASLEQITRVLDLISHADPAGIGTNGPRTALMAQLDLLPDEDSRVKLAREIIEGYFQQLGTRNFEEIAANLEVSLADVEATVSFIQENLNPYPGRAFWGSIRSARASDPNVYHTPDIQITQRDNDPSSPLVVEIFSAYPGWLRVSPIFRMAQFKKEDQKSEDWNRHVERASLFVKCVQQRNNTMRQLMEILVDQQQDFILKGDRYLKPITRAEIAEEIGVHESTVSRAVSHKSVALPDGRIVPLAKFFDRSLSVRDQIKEIIQSEKKPLTDDQIVTILKKDGIKIARRTVAKYRAMEGILPARLRVQVGAAPA
jgi:RNA polymerase sigma-54 factor